MVKDEEAGIDDGHFARPDLVLIDGGMGQANVVVEIMADLGVDDIPVVGVAKGPGRKRALLHAFGSARGVSRASVEDLAKVEGVSEALAERVWGYFRKG